MEQTLPIDPPGALRQAVEDVNDPDVDEVVRVIADSEEPMLAACERVRRFALAMTRPWGGRVLGADALSDTLIVALFTRSYATFSAAFELARLGFGSQAAMLNRSLFEDMVDAHWIAAEPRRAEELIREHHAHGVMLLADAVAKYPSFYERLQVPDFDPAERERLDKVFGRYGTRSWTTLNLHERIERIEPFWEGKDDDLEALRFYRDIAQRDNNQTLHVSAQGLAGTLRGRDDTGVVFAMGPGLEMVDRALFGTFWIFSQTIGLVLHHFDFDVGPETRAAVFSAARLGRPAGPDF